MHWISLFIGIVAEACATSALKLTDGFTRLVPTIGVFIGYGITLLCFSFALKTISISVAYALWSGLGIVLVILIGWWCFDQSLDIAAIVGISFIMVGIIIMHLWSKALVG